MMEVKRLSLSQIKIPEGRRSIDWNNVAALTESMQERGLQQPIGVKRDGTLIWGNHRYEAARKLEWREIECSIHDVDDIDAGLMEIDENLIHAQLSTADRVIALARRKELYEARHPETKWGGSSNSGPKQKLSPTSEDLTCTPSFVEDTANKTGVSRKKIERDVRIGQSFTQQELDAMGAAKIPIHGMDKLQAVKRRDPAAATAVLEAPVETLRERIEAVTGPFEPTKPKCPSPEPRQQVAERGRQGAFPDHSGRSRSPVISINIFEGMQEVVNILVGWCDLPELIELSALLIAHITREQSNVKA